MNPGTYRPTTLRYASKHCPAAMDFFNARLPEDRRIFATGKAAHYFVQAIGETQTDEGLDDETLDALAEAVAVQLMTQGTKFEGHDEGPLPADAVWEGRDLALAYVAEHGIPGPETLRVEEGLAVDEEWTPVRYGPGARLRLIVDQHFIEEVEDEETFARTLVVRDLKSAWSTDASELATVQRKAQAVLAWIHYGESPEGETADCLRLEVVNLRSGAVYREELWMEDDGALKLEKWRHELSATMRALDEMRDENGRYRANPGGGCIGCPYLSRCEVGQSWAHEVLPGESAEDRARQYLQAKAALEMLAKVLREETDEQPVTAPDGRMIGYQAKEKRAPKPDAWLSLVQAWTERTPDLGGLVNALSPGVAGITSVAKTLYPERDMKAERDAFVAGLLTTKTERRFCVTSAADAAIMKRSRRQ